MATTALRRRYAAMAASGLAVLVSVPLFSGLLGVASEAPPPHAALLPGGAWEGVDGEGDACRLRVNKWGIASLELPAANHKGPVSFTEDALTVRPIPLPVLSSLGSTTTLHVTRWPSLAAPNERELDGVRYERRPPRPAAAAPAA